MKWMLVAGLLAALSGCSRVRMVEVCQNDPERQERVSQWAERCIDKITKSTHLSGDGIEIVDFSEVVKSCRENAEKVFPCEKTKEEFQACGAFPTNCNFDHNWIPCSETPLESARNRACVEAGWRMK